MRGWEFEARTGHAAHGSVFPFMSRFATCKLQGQRAAPIIDLIFDGNGFDDDTKDFFSFIQIQRYMPGDFIVPHKDDYDITKLHLVTLTSSNVDGIMVQDGNDLVRVFDKAGQKVEFDYHAWHWVDPVQTERYSLVVGE